MLDQSDDPCPAGVCLSFSSSISPSSMLVLDDAALKGENVPEPPDDEAESDITSSLLR
ncbi:hypothetical protein TRAPUB_3000 [Trametes pubescens]|uniref:Uncharacterized protein n=1 Tax=Trametes pubescens TaxID=154538 RepID=A0A1M2VER1_TRAPU|nr:hypothetical protein TRAPUB_3088 [Trametes pubescens]OJT06065.1 hypothetical protein TRAPUB_3000 [Trametes pubescens]